MFMAFSFNGLLTKGQGRVQSQFPYDLQITDFLFFNYNYFFQAVYGKFVIKLAI